MLNCISLHKNYHEYVTVAKVFVNVKCVLKNMYYNFSHGTNCAGIIAGEDNAICGVGVAFEAQISSK